MNPMSTTSLKLPEDLKLRAAAAAHDLGMTPHAFMIDAIRRAATAAEQRAQFVAEALAARAHMLHTGLGYDTGEVGTYLRNRVTDRELPPPLAKPWRS